MGKDGKTGDMMDIKHEKRGRAKFKRLSAGRVFMYGNVACMVIQFAVGDYNAVNLETGHPRIMDGDEWVDIVENARMVVNDL